MIKNYLKAALRNMRLHKGLSFITIFGFAAGLACCILITIYAVDQLSFDRQLPAAERIHRVYLESVLNNMTRRMVVTCAPLAETMKREMPEVEAVTRFIGGSDRAPVVRYKDKVFSEDRFYWADPTFFDVFAVPFLRGDPRTALAKANTVVLTQAMAKKYFGAEDPLGKTINTDNRLDLVVTGVVADVPRQSHFHYDFVGPLTVIDFSHDPFWGSNNFYTYVKLRPGSSVATADAKLAGIVRRYAGPQFEKLFNTSYERLIKSGARYGYFLQPLTSIHLHSHIDCELEPNGDIATVRLFLLVAFGVFVLACVNFVNLATTRAVTRAREIGIRKAIGSGRGQLVRQFLFESFLTSFLAILLAVVLAVLLRPLYNHFSGGGEEMTLLANPWLPLILAALLLLSGLGAGAYPAFYLSSFHPVQALKGSRGGSGGKSILRSLLVVFQFAVSITLVIGTLAINRQLNYIQNKKLGFNKEQVLVVRKTDDLGKQVRAFQQELLSQPGVMSVSNSSELMGDPNFSDETFQLSGSSDLEPQLIWNLRTDESFVRTYGIEMAAGRFFERDRPTDAQGIVLNETAVKILGLVNPVGKVIERVSNRPGGNEKLTVLGVMRDFHFQSLHYPIGPLLIRSFGADRFGNYMSVRFHPANTAGMISGIEAVWKRLVKGQSFECEFFDDRFAALYNSEQNTSRLLAAFTILAIVIACLGLFGLAAFATQQRTKEVGIRKALGASVLSVSRLLSSEFLKLVLLANFIAWPLAYFFMNRWLRDFAYRASLRFELFLVSGALTLGFALLTVSFQTIRAARAKPVDSLRYE